MKAWVHTESWAGRAKHEVEILGATPKRYRVRAVESWRVGHGRGRRSIAAGDVVLVPRGAVRDEAGKPITYEATCSA
jgi:hypothetical protein